jgi:hypothetical protein
MRNFLTKASRFWGQHALPGFLSNNNEHQQKQPKNPQTRFLSTVSSTEVTKYQTKIK